MVDPTPIANNAQLQTNLRLLLGAGATQKAFQKHVSNVQFAPSGGGAVTWQGGTPDAKLVGRLPQDWVCNLTLAMDFDNADSLANFLLNNAGQKVAIAYSMTPTGTTFYSTITVNAPQIGGRVNAFNEATVACPCTPPTTTAPA